MTKRILRIEEGAKFSWGGAKQICGLSLKGMGVDVKAPWDVKKVLEEEVKLSTGQRYKREGLPG